MKTYSLRPREVRRQLGDICHQTFRRLLALGELPYMQFGRKGHLRFSQQDVDEFIRRSQRGGDANRAA